MKELLEGLNTQQEMQLYLRVMKSEIGRKREKILANPTEIVPATPEGEEVTP